jgi:beta-lactamase superfamily II metal-dependent hydrolase
MNHRCIRRLRSADAIAHLTALKRCTGLLVSNPDADHIGGFLDVFDAFEVATVYVSGDPRVR